MVRIRYSELPAGLHVRVQADGRSTVIYLLPGLTPQQRHAALLRARSSARMGHGPSLPALAMARAIAADRIRTTAHNGLAATRRHPMLLLPPLVLMVSGAVVLVLVSFGNLTVAQSGRSPDTFPTLPVGRPQGSRQGGFAAQPGHHGRPAGQRGAGSRGAGPGIGTPAGPSPSGPSASPTPSPASSPSPSPSTQGPSPSPSPSGTCLALGPLGLCVNV